MTLAINSFIGFQAKRRHFFNVGDAVFDSTTTNTPNSAVPKPAGLSCPNPQSGRILIAQFNCRDNYGDTSFDLTSCNIGGSAAAELYTYTAGHDGHSTMSSWWWIANEVSTTVHVTGVLSGFGANMNTWVYSLYELVGYSMTLVNSQGEGASSSSSKVTINTTGANLVLLGACDESRINGSWSGGGNVTSVWDNYAADGNHTSAYDDAPTGVSTEYAYAGMNHHHAAIALKIL